MRDVEVYKMKINGIGPSKVISIYSENRKTAVTNSNAVKKDSLEISSAGRSLSSLSLDGNYGSSPEKVEEIKKQISQGTYKPNAKLVSQKMIDIIRGRDV
jgi:negative regulator of flagellin synthesis FlgM